MEVSTPQRLFNQLNNPNVMGYEVFILFPSVVLYFIASFVIGSLSSMVISDKKNKNITRTVVEVVMSLWIIAIGHKLFTILTPTSLESSSSNVIFAFVAMSANSKVENAFKSIVSKTNQSLENIITIYL